MKIEPIKIKLDNDLKEEIYFITYNELINHMTYKFLGSTSSPANVSEMEHYLTNTLKRMFPKISLNFTIKEQNGDVFITHHNDFGGQLKKYYPESLF